mgnify:CR=1 FL=1
MSSFLVISEHRPSHDIFLESQQLPRMGETTSGQKWYPKLGGKGGNQAVAASLYPVPTKILSAIGKDDFANYIIFSAQQIYRTSQKSQDIQKQ